MEGTEKRMEAKIITDAFFIGQYKIANKYIKDLNKRYEDCQAGFNRVTDPSLAGRLDSELEMLNIIQSTDYLSPKLLNAWTNILSECIEFRSHPQTILTI